ncbi:bifunctional nuclease family protein [Marivirga sp. S37H4]|uniref:Bifunctional nuclease family protein n=1 Tax=Marivirga aurantiaca TaxID=2802615 RepID=A0A934WXR9_9BACT|nr:bifunctional nuclease family protein [Marivirga aurantiaca]MBK6264832.1 bifunctional nuclease family protein [Marivirga aurantiaca]
MEKIKLEILGLSSSQSQSGSFALVLGESDGNRRLPIIIGMFEAQAIAIEIEKIVPNRPMTHDLFKSFAKSFGYAVKEIVISDLKEGVFFAKIVCDNGQGVIEIDSRPSDAIAIGIRFDAPIFTYEKIMSEAGIILTDEAPEGDISELKRPISKEEPSSSGKSKQNDELKDLSMDKLNDLLDKTIKAEDYEMAAKIRDEINRRN